MAKNAHSIPTSTRRSLGAGLFATVIGAGITAGAAASLADLVPANPDAQLVALGTEGRKLSAHYGQLQDRWWTLQCADPDLESCAAEMDGPHNQLCDLADQARDIQASTPEGWQAKAVLIRHLMIVEHSLGGKMEFETFDQELIWSLICDMTGRA